MAASTIVKICLFLLMSYHYYTRVRVRCENDTFIYLLINQIATTFLRFEEYHNQFHGWAQNRSIQMYVKD